MGFSKRVNNSNARVKMASTRDTIVDTVCTLLEAQGYHATGLNQIVKESGAPRGSLYYYFPAGKDELTAEAIERTGRQLAAHVRQSLAAHADPAEAVRALVEFIANSIEASGCRSGGPLMTVALETTENARLNAVCRAAYQQLHGVFEEKLLASGYSAARAAHLAVFVNAALEGGIVLSRVQHNGVPLRVIARELFDLLRNTAKE